MKRGKQAETSLFLTFLNTGRSQSTNCSETSAKVQARPNQEMMAVTTERMLAVTTERVAVKRHEKVSRNDLNEIKETVFK